MQPPSPLTPTPISDVAHAPAPEVAAYRQYLLLLARVQLDPRKAKDVDASDIVQQSLLEAHRNWGRFRGGSEGERAAWLRRILACNLADALRSLGREKRDAGRRVSLEQQVEQSSLRLGNFLAADQSSPSQGMHRAERGVMLANAMADLPEAQREALVLQYWHGWTLAQIGQHMNRTPVAVAGLLKRGLKQLREAMQQQAGPSRGA